MAGRFNQQQGELSFPTRASMTFRNLAQVCSRALCVGVLVPRHQQLAFFQKACHATCYHQQNPVIMIFPTNKPGYRILYRLPHH